MAIKEFFTAHYDTNTDSIKGCSKNSYFYFHELQHQKQMKNKILFNLWKWTPVFTQIICLGIFITSLTSGLWKIMWFAGISTIPLSILLLYLELEANIVGYIKYKEAKK